MKTPSVFSVMIFIALSWVISGCATPSQPAAPNSQPTQVSTLSAYPGPGTPIPTAVRTTPIPPQLTPQPPEVTDALEQPRQITTRPAPRGQLAIHGNYIIWRSYEDTRTNVVAYNLATNEERRISSLPKGKNNLRISGNYVVWQETFDLPEKGTGIRAYNLATNQEIAINSPGHDENNPDVSNGIVVWNDSRNLKGSFWVGDIYGYDLSTGEEFPIAIGPGLHVLPRIAGNWVIYLDWAPGETPLRGQPTLRAFNIRTKETIEIGPARYSEQMRTEKMYAISGDRIAWLGSGGIRIYDLATHQTRPLNSPSIFDGFHGNWLDVGSRLWNIDTGVQLDYFQAWQANYPTQVNDIVHDGKTMAWIYGGANNNEGRVYAARMRRWP